MPEGLWSLAVIAGPIALAIALVFGIVRWRRRTPAEKARTEQATRENYGKVRKD
ncbi:MAG: hypothetical protein ACK4NA_05340 [Alphaproteobacteria bacterium]